ncbi:MAG TPA: hypothetical protein VGT05_01505 [Patescibacteria group bacterium]|nr:hypothetical protein [Patescibacteria group bacterium]
MKLQHALSMQGIFVLVFLVIEYFLGMFTNLFISFPNNTYGGKAWVFAWRQIPLALHIIVGFSLLVGAIVLVVRAIRQKNKNWILASVIGFIAILSAALAGALFISLQRSIYSFIMAISFVVALFAYGWGVYKER